MPLEIVKIPNRRKYRVINDGKVVAKGTSHKKALAQARLIRAVDHGWMPTKRITPRTPKLR